MISLAAADQNGSSASFSFHHLIGSMPSAMPLALARYLGSSFFMFAIMAASFRKAIDVRISTVTRSFLWFFIVFFNIFAEKKTYYAGMMLDAPSIVLCSKLCRHNVSDLREPHPFHVKSTWMPQVQHCCQ